MHHYEKCQWNFISIGASFIKIFPKSSILIWKNQLYVTEIIQFYVYKMFCVLHFSELLLLKASVIFIFNSQNNNC